MKRYHRALRWASAAVAVVLSLAVYKTTATAQADEAALRTVLEQFTNAWNRGDAGNAAATFTADGVLIAGEGTQTTGRQQIERYLAQTTGTLPKGAQFVASPITNVRFLAADVALLQTEGGFLMPGETAVAPERRGVNSIILVREGAAWRIALAQRTRILAPAPKSQ